MSNVLPCPVSARGQQHPRSQLRTELLASHTQHRQTAPKCFGTCLYQEDFDAAAAVWAGVLLIQQEPFRLHLQHFTN